MKFNQILICPRRCNISICFTDFLLNEHDREVHFVGTIAQHRPGKTKTGGKMKSLSSQTEEYNLAKKYLRVIHCVLKF